MYDGKTQFLIKNPINRYVINSPMLPSMKKNADGSLTLYIQMDSPGKVKLHQAVNLTAAGAVSGGFWGTLIGLIFLNSLLGLVVGATAGAVSGALSDVGIDDKFMKELAGQLKDGSSVLFVLVRHATPDKVLEELKGTGGHILRTSLSHDDEAKLQAPLDAARQ